MKRIWYTITLSLMFFIFYTGYNSRSNHISITEQQYTVPEVKTHIKKLFLDNQQDLGQLFDLVVEVALREKMYATSHEVFYQANSQLWFFLSLLRTALVEAMQNTLYEHFMYLRVPSQQYDFHQSVTEVVIERGILNVEGKFPDKQWSFGNILLSVNLSLVGNALYEGESVFDFFLKNYNINPASLELIKQIIDEWLQETSRIILTQDDFDTIYNEFDSLFSFLNTGVIYQIFIPHQLVGKLVYLAKYGGRFYFDDTNPEHQAHYIMAAIEESKKEPSLKTNKYQARILCDLHTMLSPQSGVLIFTYALPSQQKQFDESCMKFKEFVRNALAQ